MGCSFENAQCSINNCQKKQSEDFTNFFMLGKYNRDDQQANTIGNAVSKMNSSKNLISKNNQTIISQHKKDSNKFSIMTNNNDMIPLPRLKLYIYSNYSSDLINTVIITPNSMQIDNNPIKLFSSPVKYIFGKDTKNDCVLNDESISLEQFHIIYSKHKFYIIDNQNGTGLFCKITGKKIIDHDLRLSFGGDYMLVKVRQNNFGGKDIKIKFCLKKELERIYNSNKKQIITIGRNKTCDICYQEDSISKVQCTFLFIKENWVIMDGSYGINKQKCSTNGIW